MEIQSSPLADTGTDHETKEIPSTYVPFRNANILAIATSWAEVVGATALYIGAVEEDSSGYPDCRDVFFRAFEQVIHTGTKPDTQICIVTPLINLRKSEIVSLGVVLGAPLQYSWSCYARQDVACGTCDSCRLRLRGFHEAGSVDPIPYSM
jgi:7-cyano-7-deazaguanine synthase